MIFEFMFFYSKDTDYGEILQIIEQYPKTSKIITNRSGLNAYLRNNNKKSFMIAEAVTETGPTGEENFNIAKTYLKEFENELNNILHLGVSIFEGFSFSLLRKLYLLAQAKKILEENENTIFIFENYSPIYFSIIKLASQMGFNNKEGINFIVKNKINFFNIEQGIDLRNNLSKYRLMNFQKKIGGAGSSKTKLKSYFLFLKRILSLIFSRIKFKTKKIFHNNEVENVLSSLEKKMEKVYSKNNIDTIFFLTTTRPDLYLRPWYPILDKFSDSKKSFLIFTSDIATSLILEKEKVTFVNFFEEMNFLQKFFDNDKNYNKFKNFCNNTQLKKNFLLGTDPILDDILKDTFRSVAVITLCDFIFKKMAPKTLVAMADGEMLECLASATARKYKIPTFSVSPTLPNPHPLLAKWFHADKIFIDGTKHSDTLTKLGYSKDRILLVGNPKYDLYRNINIKDAKNLLKKKYGVDEAKKLIVVAMSKWRKDDQKWIGDLVKFCNKNNIEIIIKVHPKFKTASNEISEKKIQEVKNSCAGLKFLITYDIELLELIPAVDLIVTDYSSVGLEAVIAEKPLISINFFGEDYEPFNDLRVDRFGAALYVEDYDIFEKYILDILEDKKYLDDLKKSQNVIVEKFNYYNDGNAANRIFNILQKN